MILVTGADGLLGSWMCFSHQNDTIGFTRKELDITSKYDIHDVLDGVRPDAVVNCAGITNHNDRWSEMRQVNMYGPAYLSNECDKLGIRMIHVSTDCVFSGKSGPYTEWDLPDADDNYGLSKSLGEIHNSPHLTVRTSFVGWPDPKSRGLMAWLESNQGKTVNGYSDVMWNGLTVMSLADYLYELSYSRQTGLMHLYGQTISKFDLLKTVNMIYDWGVEIVSDPSKKSNKTLRSNRLDKPHIPGTFNFEEQIREMSKWEIPFLKSL